MTWLLSLSDGTSVSNHPNRGQKGPQSNPDPTTIRAARAQAGLTQEAAAALVYSTERAWQKWEAGDARMHPAMFELFSLKKPKGKA
jgi:DNA-binding transcriptional regulator YiaG